MTQAAESTLKDYENGSGGRLYRAAVSIKTSLVFLSVLAFLFLVGTIFPQSSEPGRLQEYREAGGKLAGLAGSLNILNLFDSWYFTLAVGLFALHLLLCIIHRLYMLRKRPKFQRFTRESLLLREHSFSVLCSTEGTNLDVEGVLRHRGFKRLRYYSEDAHAKRVVTEKGIPIRWISWAYHLFILLTLCGFSVTYLFAFEGPLAISVGERKAVALNSHMTKWRMLTALLGHANESDSRKIEIRLEQLSTEYTQRPVLHYPKEPLKRLLAAWGLGKETIRFKLTKDLLYPHDWFSLLAVYDGGKLVKKERIEVNNPLRYAGLLFYQIGHEYELELKVGEAKIGNIFAEKPFVISQVEGELRLSAPRLGTLFGYDGNVAMLSPSANLQYRPPDRLGTRSWITIAALPLGQAVEVMHTNLTLISLKERNILGYRYDPGVPLIWVAASFLLVLMGLRIYFPWYQVRCHADSSNGRSVVTVSIRMVGLFARPERMKQQLRKAFQDIT